MAIQLKSRPPQRRLRLLKKHNLFVGGVEGGGRNLFVDRSEALLAASVDGEPWRGRGNLRELLPEVVPAATSMAWG
ncbi:hypothetical protein E2562_006946 [Oryza meyeriana var. granulata]|uniref:Uncharacterized protein n=1 Tax=Oryza meyeriana var. granulata TaxID=110450 RepID=A0A6G1EAA0_9ORYZ|nr:hypothetical protein E2562_006946 [Oryza meyeriana var. granulata]